MRPGMSAARGAQSSCSSRRQTPGFSEWGLAALLRNAVVLPARVVVELFPVRGPPFGVSYRSAAVVAAEQPAVLQPLPGRVLGHLARLRVERARYSPFAGRGSATPACLARVPSSARRRHAAHAVTPPHEEARDAARRHVAPERYEAEHAVRLRNAVPDAASRNEALPYAAARRQSAAPRCAARGLQYAARPAAQSAVAGRRYAEERRSPGPDVEPEPARQREARVALQAVAAGAPPHQLQSPPKSRARKSSVLCSCPVPWPKLRLRPWTANVEFKCLFLGGAQLRHAFDSDRQSCARIEWRTSRSRSSI